MTQLLTMVRSDLRQKMTDGSVLAFAVLVPLALMWVMNLVFSGVSTIELKPVTVAVAAPAGDELAGVIPTVLSNVPESDGFQITVRGATAAEVADLVKANDAGMGVIVPEGFSSDLTSGQGPEVKVIEGDDAGISGQVVTSIVEGTLAQLTAGTEAAFAGLDLGIAPDQLAALAQSVAQEAPQLQWREGHTASEQLGPSEALVAGQTGMFLLFTVGFGVLALVTERDQGTLARLISMPMPPWLIVVAKGLVSFILGLMATTVLLVTGTLMFDNVEFGNPVAVAVLIVLAVLATTSLMFIIAKVARTAEQAAIAQAIIAVVLGMSGGAFFPINATGFVGQVLALNPVRSFIHGLGITSGGGGLADLAQPALTLAGFTVVSLVLARVLPGRKELL